MKLMQPRSSSSTHGHPGGRRQRGMTLIELMVGATVAIIALLMITSVVLTASRQNKTTVTGSDAQTTGAIASYLLERDIRMAGNGLAFPSDVAAPTAICEIQAHDIGSPDDPATTGVDESRPAENFGISMTPLLINANASGTPDTITVFYGNPSSGGGFSTASLNTYNPGTPTSFALNNGGISFAPGNLFVVAPVANVVSQVGDARPDCYMGENVAAANASPLLSTAGGTYALVRGASVLNFSPQYNIATGSPVTFTGAAAGTGDMVFNLGNRPSRDAQNRLFCALGDCAVSRTYAIVNNNLTMTENLLGPGMRTAWPVASDVVMLKAQYGKDTNADGIVDTWDATLTDGVTDANGDSVVGVGDELWSQWNVVRAIRFAVVTRSKTRETALVTASPLTLWTGNTWTLTDEQRHYRYRVYSTVVPVRNNLWRQ